MESEKLAILGSTGSIGTQALEIVQQHPEKYDVCLLTANSKWESLLEQISQFKPDHAVICTREGYESLKQHYSGDTQIHLGAEVINELVQEDDIDTVLNSLVGFAGFEPTYHAIRSNKKIALANKESLVVGGELINHMLDFHESVLIPVDSEHSAMLQCLVGEDPENVEKIIITASGGPFRDLSLEEIQNVTVDQALKHPNWDMGAKITIDSSTMMNKGLEIIEAHWLFGIPIEKIEPVIHPQSIIHSIVTFVDGSSKAQLGPPDMKVPIVYALSYPDRFELETPRMDWSINQDLNFYPVDYQKFPCVKLAMDSISAGGYAPAILNAANEIAVQRFLDREIGYIHIPKIVESCLEKITFSEPLSVDNLKLINTETRALAAQVQ